MAHRSVWIATNMSCTQPGRSGSALLSGAHLEQNAHRTAVCSQAEHESIASASSISHSPVTLPQLSLPPVKGHRVSGPAEGQHSAAEPDTTEMAFMYLIQDYIEDKTFICNKRISHQICQYNHNIHHTLQPSGIIREKCPHKYRKVILPPDHRSNAAKMCSHLRQEFGLLGSGTLGNCLSEKQSEDETARTQMCRIRTLSSIQRSWENEPSAADDGVLPNLPDRVTRRLNLLHWLHLVLVTDDTFMPVGNVRFIEFVVTC
ncbi:hypothetical protein D9C73_013710 [Collichthys lucidus]|uniref:Uncharacterized protein n=1 Tax=Collichthys lucidus TaxID=240159 RepID=A0A4U5UXL5_COLLU|nr:hypothetical protein D9C73_013710 [Collichthys lucidus]